MNIDIQQEKISIGARYDVLVDGQQSHSAASRFPRIRAVIDLVTTPSRAQTLTIRRRFALFKADYDIVLPDGKVAQFRTQSYWQKHFQCTCGADNYDIYGHRGRKFSVYKNDVQVAWWERNSITFFKGDSYRIVTESGPVHLMVIAFCLIIDNYSNSDGSSNMITINFGSLIGGARPFDPSWAPRA
jgi:hypothetical protein